MLYLNKNIEIETISILISVGFFSFISLLCCIFSIYTYFKMKQKTIIYHFFFHFSINEILSRLTLIAKIVAEGNVTLFRIISFIIYFTDTNIIMLIAFICFGMYQLILKQNTKLSTNFHKFSIILYIVSLIITIGFFIWTHNEEEGEGEGKNNHFFRKIISLAFITDNDKEYLGALLFTNIIYFGFLVVSIVFIVLIQIFIKDGVDTSKIDKEGSIEDNDKRIKSALKFKAFRIKLLAYPSLSFLHVFLIFPYCWLEYYYLKYKCDFDEETRIVFLRARYALFNLYCIFNSIRGILLFLVFTMNEKIKKNLFKKVLFCDIFKTIDKIKKEEENQEGSSTNIERTSTQSLEREMSFNDSSEEYVIKKMSKKMKNIKQENKDEDKDDKEKKLMEMDINPNEVTEKIGLLNNKDNESSEEEDDDDNDDEEEEEKKDEKEK